MFFTIYFSSYYITIKGKKQNLIALDVVKSQKKMCSLSYVTFIDAIAQVSILQGAIFLVLGEPGPKLRIIIFILLAHRPKIFLLSACLTKNQVAFALLTKEIKYFTEFELNYMKMNNRKTHILFSGIDNISGNVYNNIIISENKNELLNIILDSKLSFENHLKNLCKKTNQKFKVLARAAPYTCLEKREQLFVRLQFRYSPLSECFIEKALTIK